MGRYRKIDPRIWNDEKFRDVSQDAQFLFLFILTHPHMTSLGAMRASVAGFADELKWAPKRVRESLTAALSKGLIEVNENACFVGCPRFLKYNPPESPNVVRSWINVLDLIPECNEKTLLVCRVIQQMKGLGKPYLEALPLPFPEAARKALGQPWENPEPEPEPEPEPLNPLTPLPGEVSAWFEEFWLAYPKKKAKQDALIAWQKLKPTREIATAIMSALAEQKRSRDWTKNQGQYVPYPHRWLRKRRFDDDVVSNGTFLSPDFEAQITARLGGA